MNYKGILQRAFQSHFVPSTLRMSPCEYVALRNFYESLILCAFVHNFRLRICNIYHFFLMFIVIAIDKENLDGCTK